MSKKFTIVFPTRERPTLLDKLIQSILNTTHDLNAIEVMIAIDEDDASYDGYKFPDCCRVFRCKRSLNFSRDYYSFLASHGTGRWIIAINDDARFDTPDWDLLAEKVLVDYIGTGPNIVHGWIEDHLNDFRAKGHGKYCCFPLIGRDGFDANGFVFPSRIPTWGADIWLRKLYDNIDRVVNLPITIRHVCYHNQTRERDHINEHIANNQVGFDVEPTYDEINALLNVLREAACRKT